MRLSIARGLSAIVSTGMPIQHGRAFQRVADAQGCVIAVRAVGACATGLLLESYATKGFHNKAKSCTWGPMAGFVLADPRFTKNPDIVSQRQALQEAMSSGASETPLYITNGRRQTLERQLKCMAWVSGSRDEMAYTALGPQGVPMNFILKYTTGVAGASDGLWGVFYGPQERRLSNSLTGLNQAPDRTNLLPVMAIVDPNCPEAVRHTYRAATTCDYDLWAVFPGRGSYSRSGADRRKVPGSDRWCYDEIFFEQHEDPHRGNITPRLDLLRKALNNAVCTEGYQGGDVVHHSDEAGRPRVYDIDFPCLFFTPHEDAYCAQTVQDLKQLLSMLSFNYVLGLNPGWHRQLGLTVSRGGHYEA